MKTQLERDWRDFFESGFYETAWEMVIDQEKTVKEVEGVLSILNPEPGSHILDWCGGWGRHSILFAKLDFQITLLDFSRRHLRRAKMAARQAGVKSKVNLVWKDFRQTPPYIQADYAVNLFTAGLGYLTEEDDILALKSLHSALKPKAKLLIDTMNLFWLIRNYKEEDSRWDDGQLVQLDSKREFDFLSNRNLSKDYLYKTSLSSGIRLLTQRLGIREITHRIYSLSELRCVLSQAGFQVDSFYGDFDQTPLSFDTKRLIVVASKV